MKHATSFARLRSVTIVCAIAAAACVPSCVLDFRDDEDKSDALSDAPAVPEACGFTTSLSGAVELDVALGETDGCGGQGDGTSAVMGFGTGSNPVSVTVDLEGVTPGQRASDIVATVQISRNPDGARWRTPADACSVELTRNALDSYNPSLDESTYLLEGTGTCSATAVPLDTDDDDVTLAPFSFAGEVVWPGTGGS